jgi:hypothetical protein
VGAAPRFLLAGPTARAMAIGGPHDAAHRSTHPTADCGSAALGKKTEKETTWSRTGRTAGSIQANRCPWRDSADTQKRRRFPASQATRPVPAADLPLTGTPVPTPRRQMAPATWAQANPPARSPPFRPSSRVFPSPDRRPRQVSLPREKLGEDVQPFSPSAFQTTTRRWLAGRSPSGQQDKEPNGFRTAIHKEPPRSTTVPAALSP